MFSVFSEVLRTVSETAKIPVVIILVLLLALTVILIGWVVVEGFTERRRLKVKLPALLDELREGRPEDVARCIRRSGLLISMKETLIEATRHPSFTPAMLESLALQSDDMNILGVVHPGLYSSAEEVPGTADVIIDFSYPGNLDGILARAARDNAAVVIGTTGYTEAQLE